MDYEGLDRFLTERAWLFELSLDPMLVARFDGCLQVANGAFQRMSGLALDELLEQPFLGMIHPDDRSEAQLQLDRLAKGESLRDVQLRVRAGDGSYRWTAWTITPSPAEGAFYAVGRDITERREADEVLAAQAEELARSNADLEHFASVVSHDLAQPLRVICSYADLLTGDYGPPLNDEAQELAERIQAGARHMQELVRGLLAYCKVGQGRLHREMVDANEVVAAVLRNLESALHGSELQVTALPEVFADRLQLSQVFQNLIGNAARFARPGVAAVISVAGESQDCGWEFSVTDNGIGIAPEQRKRIFEMFERIDGSAEDMGTGVGLAICARVVERHGGRIWVEDGPAGGSRFCFTLPRR